MTVTLKFFGPNYSMKGFTDSATTQFNDLPPAKIVRELIQNSLDAAVEAGEPVAIMRFRLDTMKRSDVPDIKGYREALSKAIQYWKNQSNDKTLTDAAQEIVNRAKKALSLLNSGKATVLTIMDNGVGLDVKRMNSLLSDGASVKQPGLSGSYGVGHLAPMVLSDIRYMLYGGLTKDGERIACGRAILATHPRKNMPMSADGYLVKSFKNDLYGNVFNFLSPKSHPKLVTNRIDEIDQEWGHGCVVMIPAFNNFRGKITVWEIVSKVAAYNFCPAIHQNQLIIEVCEQGKKKVLDKGSLQNVLKPEQIKERAARRGSILEGLRPSGQNAYSIQNTLAKGNSELVKTKLGKAKVSLLLESPTDRPRVDLFRNGMWITDDVPNLRPFDFAGRQPFHAVIEIEGQDDNSLHRFIRKAEGPMHDKLSFMLLSDDERKDLEKALTFIATWLKRKVPTVGRDEFTVDDFLLVSTDPGGKKGRESFSFWGKPTIMLRRSVNQLATGSEIGEVDPPSDPDDSGTSDKPPSPPRSGQTKSSSLPFRSVVVPDNASKINAWFSSDQEFPEIVLTLRVDENSDATCDRVWPDETVSIESFSITSADDASPTPTFEILQEGRAVKIQGIAAQEQYNVEVKCHTPSELTNAVDLPVFRLELYRPPRDVQESGKHTDEGEA